MLKTSRQTPATNRVHTQLRRRLKRRRPRPRPTITSPSSSPISTSSRSPSLAAPADAASCDSADRRPRRPRSSTTRRPCGGGDAALAMAAADVAVTCLQREGRGRAPGRAAPARGGRRDAVLRSHARAVEDAAAPRFRRAAAPPPRRRLAVVAPPPECRPHAAVRLRAAAPLLDPKYTPIRSTSTTFLIPQHLARRTRTYRSTTAGSAGQE